MSNFLFLHSYLIELLAKEGFLIISVPYNVTFDHAKAANAIFDNFHSCYKAILTSGLPEYGLSSAELLDLPLYSVGHRSVLGLCITMIKFYLRILVLDGSKPVSLCSNGALLQVLSGSYFSEKIPKVGSSC